MKSVPISAIVDLAGSRKTSMRNIATTKKREAIITSPFSMPLSKSGLQSCDHPPLTQL
jgi:hypothetical protein